MAITTWNSLDEFELTNTLFGSDVLEIPRNRGGAPRRFRRRDGCWRPGAEPRGAQVSAVLFGDTMRAWLVASKLPELWINPWPVNAMTAPRVGQSERRRSSRYDPELISLSGKDPL